MYQLSLEHFTSCGAHRTGHFRLSSGLHSADYLQCALFLAYPQRAETSASMLAGLLREMELAVELVVAPAMGGIIIGHETARALDVPCFFTERVEGLMCLRRGFAVTKGQKVLVVEDVVTTGKSTKEVIALLGGAGAEIAGVASLVNRSPQENPFAPLPYASLLRVQFESWKPEQCPLCAEGTALDAPGSRFVCS